MAGNVRQAAGTRVAEAAAPEAAPMIAAMAALAENARQGMMQPAPALRPSRSGDDHEFFNLGAIFVALALLINFLLDIRFPFAGFNLIPSSSFGGWQQLLSGIGSLYFVLKGPIFVLISLLAVVKGRNYVSAKIFVGLLAIITLSHFISPTYRQYVSLTVTDTVLFLVLALELTNKRISRESFGWLTTFWVLLYAFAGMAARTGNYGALIHLSFILMFYLMRGGAYAQRDPDFRRGFVILMLLDFLLIGALSYLENFGAWNWVHIPILTIGTVFIVQEDNHEPSGFSKIGMGLAIVGLVLGFGFGAITALAQQGTDLGGVPTSSGEIAERLSFWNPATWFSNLQKDINRSISIASGQDRYAGQVDANAKKKLGVQLEDVEKNTKLFYTDEMPLLYATIVAENLRNEEEGLERPLDISVGCSVKTRQGGEIKGTVYPNNGMFRVEEYSVEPVQCTFAMLPAGAYEAKFSVEFTFSTNAYLKRYLVSKEMMDDLRRRRVIEKDEDVLKLNGITNIQEEAQNSFAPVQIDASDRIPLLIKLSQEQDTLQFFGILLKNIWQGKIQNITDIRVFVPEGMSLEQCSPFEMGAAGTEDGYSGYGVTENIVNSKKVSNIDKLLEERCWLNIPANSGLLDQGEITTRYFRMEADYRYLLEKSVQIRVQEAGG